MIAARRLLAVGAADRRRACVLQGRRPLAGLLMVGTIGGILMATVLNNGGGAWDNAKKFIEAGWLKDADGNVLGKRSDAARGRRRRRHRRRPVQGHRRPVAARADQAARDDHAGAGAALRRVVAARHH